MISLLLAAIESGGDADLVIALRSGDQAALEQIFGRYYTRLHTYLLRRGIPPQEAEDVVQNAFITIWQKRESLDPNKSLKAYLYRTCHNRALNYFRDNAKFVKGEELPEVPKAANQESDLEYSELQATLDKAVAELPDKRRAVFEMCFINGLTYKEAAEALDISVKTVENQMGHAFKAIRERVQHLLEE